MCNFGGVPSEGGCFCKMIWVALSIEDCGNPRGELNHAIQMTELLR
jgi:hypothetical protein